MSDNYQAVFDAIRSRFHGCDVDGAIRSVLGDAFGMANHHMACVAQEYAYAASQQARPVVVYRPTLSVDGNMYCFLYGDDLVQGISGFGETAALAADDFDKNWITAKASP